MSNQTIRTRRACRIDREGSTRTVTRTAIATGTWDTLPTRMASRVNRRGYLEVAE